MHSLAVLLLVVGGVVGNAYVIDSRYELPFPKIGTRLTQLRPSRLCLRGGGNEVEIRIRCKETQPGENVGVVGSGDGFGNWKTPIKLSGKDFPKWKGKVAVNPGETVEYKYCIVGGDGSIARWETKSKDNRKLEATEEVINSGKDDGDYGKIPGSGHGGGGGGGGGGGSVDMGHAVNVESVAGLDKFGQYIAKKNQEHGSWRQKLEFVRNLFYEQNAASEAGFEMKNPSTDNLACIAIYLHFLGTNQIECFEDGRHYRPNHHSNLASDIDKALDGVPLAPSNAYVIRKIRPLLPSYSSAYTASVPLTRIRDIAHRSDIPKDMKDDIKHNLQNKLHRCAGPEDLVTAERIWNKAEHGDYSGAFKEQMRIFMVELKEFFNAAGLEDRLHELKGRSLPSAGSASLIDAFLEKKWHGMTGDKLEALLHVRRECNSFLDSAPHGEDKQRVRLTDVALEQYAFVLLAEAAKYFEDSGPSALDTTFALKATAAALENAKMSMSVDAKEAEALEAEALSMEGKPLDLLRLKAWVDRCTRLCTNFSDAMQKLFLAYVVPLGQALGVDGHSASVFVEAEVRASVVFQLSRIMTCWTKYVKKELNAPPWTALYPGKAHGKLIEFDNIAAILNAPHSKEESIIALLRSAEGDEDIPDFVSGIVLAHELPLLSHLGVRARQQGVVFTCSDGAEAYNGIRNGIASSIGSTVELEVSASGQVALKQSSVAAKKTQQASAPVVLSSNMDTSKTNVVPNDQASEAVCGAKASAAAEILTIADKNQQLFKAPPGCVLPFGAMLASAKSSLPEYSKLASDFDAAATSGDVADQLAAKIRSFIQDKWTIPPNVVSSIQGAFDGNVRVMVRSSANCEDLQKISGAGLYDSIANVPIQDAAAVGKAVSRVWQSLWTKRAALSRRAAGMKHEDAAMGILIQQMVAGDLSFIAFSNNPITRDPNQVYVELCVGMGETLASAGQSGTPYRISFDRTTNEVSVLALSSFSSALVPAKEDGAELSAQTIDYSKVPFHTDGDYRKKLVARIGAAVVALEKARGSPQDVEGVISDSNGPEPQVHIVQARPMVLADE